MPDGLETTLGALVDSGRGFIQTGPFGSQLHARDYVDEGIPVVMPQQLGDNEIRTAGISRVAEHDRDRLARHVMHEGDIVFSRRGDVTRRAYITEKEDGWLCGTGCLLVRLSHPECDNRYLVRLLALHEARSYLTRHAIGATMPNLNQGILSAVPVVLPSREHQERIVDVPSAYDDLIENNRRRIRLLEQSARLLYEEWFVRLRFPGHESATVVDGVPEGWERRRIAEVCDTVGGGTPSTKIREYWDGDVTWVVPSDVTNNDCLVLLDSERKITERGLRESSARMIPAGTILMTSRASVGFFALVDREVATNQGFINIIPGDEELRMYVLFNLMSRVAEIRANAKGTTYPEISKGRFRAMDIVIPEKHVAAEFSDIATEITRHVRCLKRTTRELARARDRLLPRLMNGGAALFRRMLSHSFIRVYTHGRRLVGAFWPGSVSASVSPLLSGSRPT